MAPRSSRPPLRASSPRTRGARAWGGGFGSRSARRRVRPSTNECVACLASLLSVVPVRPSSNPDVRPPGRGARSPGRSEEQTSELQSPQNLVRRLLLEKKKTPCLAAGPDKLRYGGSAAEQDPPVL